MVGPLTYFLEPGDEVVVKTRITALFCPTFITSPLVFCKKNVHLIKEIVFAFNIKIRRRSYKYAKQNKKTMELVEVL